jgi:hypothetical protein
VTWLLDLPDPGTPSSRVHNVPEPGTLWSVGAGLALLALLGRRRR